MAETRITKVLTPNDVGETGGHQDGICIPKDHEILEFFPQLDKTSKNPRKILSCDTGSGVFEDFAFIYYNGKFFGGTRNEYRITGLMRYFRENALKSGDTIILSKDDRGRYSISFEKANNDSNVLIITSTKWKSVRL